MELLHEERIKENTGSTYLDKISVLNIPDQYEAMNSELIELLQKRVKI